MKEQIKNIVKILKEIRTEDLPKLDDNVILEQSVDIFISDRIQQGKQANIQSINKDKKVAVNGSKQATDSDKWKGEPSPATAKQIYKLHSLGYTGTDELSKAEASKLIEEMINRGLDY